MVWLVVGEKRGGNGSFRETGWKEEKRRGEVCAEAARIQGRDGMEWGTGQQIRWIGVARLSHERIAGGIREKERKSGMAKWPACFVDESMTGYTKNNGHV